MKGVYLCACKARHLDYDIIYNDYDKKYKCDLTCDMRDVDLSDFDYVIASPPCNYWSKMNYRREISRYALATKDLLIYCLNICAFSTVPVIVENVKNIERFESNYILDFCRKHSIFYQVVGRHIYFTNIAINLNTDQQYDFKNGGILINNDKYREGGYNVHKVIEIWLKYIHKNKFVKYKQFTIDDFI